MQCLQRLALPAKASPLRPVRALPRLHCRTGPDHCGPGQSITFRAKRPKYRSTRPRINLSFEIPHAGKPYDPKPIGPNVFAVAQPMLDLIADSKCLASTHAACA